MWQVEEKAAASEEWVEEGGDVIDSTGGLGIVLVAGEGGEFGAWKVSERVRGVWGVAGDRDSEGSLGRGR